jgi:hypothetical protein
MTFLQQGGAVAQCLSFLYLAGVGSLRKVEIIASINLSLCSSQGDSKQRGMTNKLISDKVL